MTVPHARTVIAFCVVAIFGYSVFSAWAVFYSSDAALRGDVIGTWKSFAVGAFTFWVGSSSGGKAKPDEPVKTEIVNTRAEPVPTSSMPDPMFGGPRPGDSP